MVTVTETKTRCDVFGTVKDVETYTVSVYREHDGSTESRVEVVSTSVDLSPRALERLQGLIRRGVNPPPPRTTAGG